MPPAHAILHAGQRARGIRKVGRAGSCMRNATQGRARTQWGRGTEGKRRPPHPRVVRGPIEAHGVGQKGEGRLPRAERLCGTPARKRRWSVTFRLNVQLDLSWEATTTSLCSLVPELLL